MTTKRNLTIRLDEDIILKARVAAARQGMSISGLVRRVVEQLARDQDVYDAAMSRAFSELETGLHLGGPPYLSRDDAHVR